MGLDQTAPLWKIDALIAGQLFNIVSESRYRYFDIGPVIYHLENRKRVETVLKAIIIGGINNLPDEKVLETLEAIMDVRER